MKRAALLILALLFALNAAHVFAATEHQTRNSVIVYAYTPSCSDCKKTSRLLETLPAQMEVAQGENHISDISIIRLNMADSGDFEVIKAMFESRGKSEQDMAVPAIFYNGGSLIGYDEVEQNLMERLSDGSFVGMAIEEAEPVGSGNLSVIPAMLLSGLIGGFNPCSLSMLLFLLSLIAIKTVSPIRAGLTYIGVKAITYFLLGTVSYSVVSYMSGTAFTWLRNFVNIFVLFFFFVVALYNILDYFAAKKENYSAIRLQLPEFLRRFNQNVISFATKSGGKTLLFAIAAAAVVVSAGEFLCTGQVYLASIIYAVQSGASILPSLLLILYITAACLPQLVIVLAVGMGKRTFVISEAVRERMPMIKLITGIFMMIVGIYYFITEFLM